MGQPVVDTREAAARLECTPEAATMTLRSLAGAGLVEHVRRGLWVLDRSITPTALAPYLTAPHPAYISFWSALAHHGMIEQIPSRTEVASLSRTATIPTSRGVFAIHRLAPEVYFGYDGTPQSGYMATPEKALFDTVYMRTPRGGAIRLPELTLPDQFDADALHTWIGRIPSARNRTLVERGLAAVLEHAEREHQGRGGARQRFQ